MGDGVFQIRSKDDRDIHQFCLADNKNFTVNCSDISALLTIPQLPSLTKIDACEATTELITTELTSFTTEETDIVSGYRTSTEASDQTIISLKTDSGSSDDNPSATTTPVDGGGLTDTVSTSQQSTSNVDLLTSTTTIATPRGNFISATPGSKNPNAAFIIGFTSLGGLFLIVIAVILFYKFYYKPKKSRSLSVTPTSGSSPQEVNGPLRFHDPDKRFLELHPSNSIQAWDGKNETKEPYVKAENGDGTISPPLLTPVASTMPGGESDVTKPKNKKKKKKKKKSPETSESQNAESPVIGNGTGEPKEVIT